MITLQQGTVYMGTAAPASGGGSGEAVWGSITGTLADQTDLATALAGKQDTLTAGTNITISNGTISATDTTYSAFTGADGSVAGSAGLVPAPAASDNTKFLKGDGTWGTATGIQNTATGAGALTILGTATNVGYAINIGNGSMITGGDSGVAVGNSTEVSAIDGIAVGHGAKSMQQYAYQIGMGINNTTKSLAVGFGYNGSTPLEYQLLDGTTGKIPLDRMPYSAGTGVTIGNDGTISATGSVSYDNSTINENSSNQLQTIAVVNKNTAAGATNPLNLWEGTSEEYASGGGSQTWYNWQSGGGLSFTASTMPITFSGGEIAFGNGNVIYGQVFNGGSSNRVVISSDNGATWSSLNTDVTSQYRYSLSIGGIAYGNGTWVISFYNNNNKYFAYSTDNGYTWTLTTLSSVSSNQWYGTAYGNNLFVSISAGRETAYSTDGQSWSKGGNLPGNSSNWEKLTFYDGKFLSFAYNTTNAAYSVDGQSWTEITLPANKNWQGIVYGNNKLVLCCYGNTDNIIYSDDMGQTWSTTTIPFTTESGIALIYNNGIFLALSYNEAAYSTDAVNWTKVNMTNSDYSWKITVGDNNTYVYAGASNASGYGVISAGLECFTTDSAPTTASTVYSAPNTTSALTITSVGTGTITLSDTNTYNYNASGNQTTTQSVGEAHPDWICLIEGVGIKKGNTTIA